jgi:ubiquinone biosynthesis protein COQ9
MSRTYLKQISVDTHLINALLKHYPEFKYNDELLLDTLGDAGYIKRNNNFKENGFNLLKVV